MPFKPGWSDSGGTISAKVKTAATAKATDATAGGQAGAEFKKSLAAGMTSQAMSAVLDAYVCRVRVWAGQSGRPDAYDISAAALAIGQELDQYMADAGDYILAHPDATNAMAPNAIPQVQPANAPTIPAQVLNAALAPDDSNDYRFRNTTILSLMGGTGVVTAGACGGVIAQSLVDGDDKLKAALATVRSILFTRADPTSSRGAYYAYLAIGRQIASVAQAAGKTQATTPTVVEQCKTMQS